LASLINRKDTVDEFDGDAGHPFMNQIALVDKAIQDVKVSRERYEGGGRLTTRTKAEQESGSVSSGETMLPDPFDGFRTQTLDPASLPTVTLASGTYAQAPSRFASLGNLVSVYSTVNKADWPGELHPGTSVDTRFGNMNRSGFGTLPQHVKRENQKHRLHRYMHERDMDEVRARYNPRSGRLLTSTTRGWNQRGGGRFVKGNDNGNFHHRENCHFNGAIQQTQQMTGNRDKIDPATRNGSAALVGSQTFSSQLGQVNGFPPKVNIVLHPGQEYTNKVYAEQLQRERERADRRLADVNFRQLDSDNTADQVGVSHIPGALVARAAQLAPRSSSAGLLAEQSGFHSMSQPDVGFGTAPHGIGQPLPIGQSFPIVNTMLAGQTQPVFLHPNSGIPSFGFHGPLVQQPLVGHSLMAAPLVAAPLGGGRPGTPYPVLRSSYSMQDITNMQRSFGNLNIEDPFLNCDTLAPPVMRGNTTTPEPKKTRRGQRSNRALARQADIEYSRYLDELNQESRGQGDALLEGDMMSGHAKVRIQLQPPSPLKMGGKSGIEDDDEADEEERIDGEGQQAWADLMTSPERKIPGHHLSPAVYDSTTGSFIVSAKRNPHILAATRPPTESPVVQDGRKSVPTRSRPALLSPINFGKGQERSSTVNPEDSATTRKQLTAESNLIFGEKPGSVSSRDPSPAGGLRRSASSRRWFEQ
jgi:hypothetical protein